MINNCGWELRGKRFSSEFIIWGRLIHNERWLMHQAWNLFAKRYCFRCDLQGLNSNFPLSMQPISVPNPLRMRSSPINRNGAMCAARVNYVLQKPSRLIRIRVPGNGTDWIMPRDNPNPTITDILWNSFMNK